MTECRKYSPDLILLNHRLNLGDAMQYATTFLWEGAETYIDVHMTNRDRTGTHNRVAAISRGLVPNLERLTEDHGVCISSCLDYLGRRPDPPGLQPLPDPGAGDLWQPMVPA